MRTDPANISYIKLALIFFQSESFVLNPAKSVANQ